MVDLTGEVPNEKGYISKLLVKNNVYCFNVYDPNGNLVFHESRTNTNQRAKSLYEEVSEKYGQPTRYASKYRTTDT